MEREPGQGSASAITILQPAALPVTQPTAEPPDVNRAFDPDVTANDKLGPLKEISGRGRCFSKLRSDTIIPTEGHEGILIAPKLYKGQAVAVYTSGGDASGLLYVYNTIVC